MAHLARALELAVPDLALIELDAAFGGGERDPEIQDLLRASHGTNVALRYLDGAFNLDPVAVPEAVDEPFATRLVWLDALVTNPDRTAAALASIAVEIADLTLGVRGFFEWDSGWEATQVAT